MVNYRILKGILVFILLKSMLTVQQPLNKLLGFMIFTSIGWKTVIYRIVLSH